MNIDVSTLNILLTCVMALQAWQVREIYKVKGKLSNLNTRFDIHEKFHEKD